MKTRGSYVLTCHLPRKQKIPFAKKQYEFQRGYYIYTGSAQNGLETRLKRHLSTPQKPHWHIDRLLEPAHVMDIQLRFSENKSTECTLSNEIKQWPQAQPVPEFGASDCTCPTHLFYFPHYPPHSIRQQTFSEKLESVYGILNSEYENHAIKSRDPFKTLVSCVLSLRTKDEVTDKATEHLFRQISRPEDLGSMTPESIAKEIYPVGMFRQKGRTLKQIADILQTNYAGRVPQEIDALTELPGVGRKTANLVRSFAFHLPGICVDTHVHRITNRWGIVRTRGADETEQELRRILPEKFWVGTNPLLVQHGQQICRPGRPKCTACPIARYCLFPDIEQEHQLLQHLQEAPLHPALGDELERTPPSSTNAISGEV